MSRFGVIADSRSRQAGVGSGNDRGGASTDTLIIGVSGARQNAAVAACVNGELRAFCEQERLTRVRRVGLEPGSLPAEALDAVLRLAGGFQPADIRSYVMAEDAAELPAALSATRVGHHVGHAAAAYYASPFDAAAVLVCDQHSSEQVSVWSATPARLVSNNWPACPAGLDGFASLYSACSALFGFLRGQEHQLEALARLATGGDADRFNDVIGYTDGALWTSPRWTSVVGEWLSDEAEAPLPHRARVASAFQQHLGRLLLMLVGDVRARTDARHLCVGGGLFYNTYFNTLIRQSAIFDDVFVAPNPGNAGLAAGAALAMSETRRERSPDALSPFLGPRYDRDEIKAILDNCKLSYECLSEGEVIATTVDELRRGRLVGWFQGRMEWGHRALGNRSILASPLSPHVLENLNVFLKQRQRHRAYGLSVGEADATRYVLGPPTSRFMEYQYQLADPGLFRHVTPEGATALRVQTIPEGPEDGPFRRFRLLHKAFGDATGVPVLVNTSFNGFSEPIVCSPRDAVRVFYGTGLDMLVLDRFVIRK